MYVKLYGVTSGRPKEKLCLSAESRKRASEIYPFLPKYRKNRKRVFLQKETLSAETWSFGRKLEALLPKI